MHAVTKNRNINTRPRHAAETANCLFVRIAQQKLNGGMVVQVLSMNGKYTPYEEMKIRNQIEQK